MLERNVIQVVHTIVECRMHLDVIERDPHWRMCENTFWSAVNTALRQQGETPWLHDTFILTLANNDARFNVR